MVLFIAYLVYCTLNFRNCSLWNIVHQTIGFAIWYIVHLTLGFGLWHIVHLRKGFGLVYFTPNYMV